MYMRWPSHCLTHSISQRCRALLRACARDFDLDQGEKLHAFTVTTGLLNSSHSYLRNVVLHMYSSCGEGRSARKLFDHIPHSRKDSVDWTALMVCYARCGLPTEALYLFADMQKQSVVLPDDITLVCVFNVCAKLCDKMSGIQGQVFMIKMGWGLSVKACNAVMDMYVKCGVMSDVRKVFDEMSERSVVSWTVLLEGVIKWEGIENGRLVFEEMPERNEVAWTVMIVGLVERGFTKEAFQSLVEMLCGIGVGLNYVILCSLLGACTQSGDLMMGKWIHVYAIKKTESEIDIMVATSLIDMYAKCGQIDTAYQVFKTMRRKNVVVWNAMLSGLAMHGRGQVALDMFPPMLREVKPDGITFTALLSACSHSGLVDQGRKCFSNLKSVYGITPSMEHYSCMVDLLGRAGKLEEAEGLIRNMPMNPNEVVLGSLLGSCSTHNKVQLGQRLMRELVQMYPQNVEYHILLSNMYALDGKTDKANSLRRILKDRGISKVPGISSIHVGGQVHQFCAGDKSHPQTQDIYLMLDEMIRKLKLYGYNPITTSLSFSRFSCEDNEDECEEKERALFSHSEKLAVCFGLIRTKPGVPLYIFKNLRICQDCHSAFKIISLVYNREIVMRDRNRFHKFKQGICSCSDYW